LSDGSRAPAEIAHAIAAAYGLDYERALNDVCKLVDDLRGANLLGAR
jgi:hypothetical protein